MRETKRRFLYILLASLIVFSSALGTVYADQPYRGTTKHKPSLRNADVNRAEDSYTDIDGQEKEADKDTVSITFTSDMEQDLGLYARVAAYFKAESGHYPRSFLIDAGNYSAKAPYNAIFSQFYPGISAMGKAGYDIVGIGSSEVSQGGDKLADMLNKAAGSDDTLPYVTTANIAGTDDLKDSFRKYGVNDYLDMNKYRTEVAVFSVVGEDAFAAAAPDKLRMDDPVKTAKKIVEEIKEDEDADMVICLCSSGIGADDNNKKLEKKIAKSVDGIDIIISCGSTTELEEPVKEGDTRIYSLAAGGEKAGRIEYVIEDNAYKYSGYSTVSLDDKYKPDKAVTGMLEKMASTANENYFASNGFASGQVLCDSFFEIAPMSSNAGQKGDSPMGELLADAYRYGATEDAKIPKGNLIAAVSDRSALSGISEGKVVINSIYDMMCIGKSEDGTKGQPLTTFYLTGKDVKALAEIAATSYSDPEAVRLYFSGLSYKYNPHRFKESRIYDATVLEDATGSQIEVKDDTLYRIVTDMETALSISGLRSADNEELVVLPKDENGNESDAFSELTRSVDKDKPLKTWIAAADYLSSFNEAGIPATYKKPDGRMKYDESKEFSHVYKGEFFTLVQLLLVALIGVAALIVLILLILNIAGVRIRVKKAGKDKEK